MIAFDLPTDANTLEKSPPVVNSEYSSDDENEFLDAENTME